jgi:uncharacterized protein YciI
MTVPPLRREVLVDVAPDVAFDRFTAGIGRWWPLARHSVGGATSTVAFTDEQLVETRADGTIDVWGEVLVWEPGRRFVITWHPGRPDGPATEVEVRFDAAGAGTKVVLEHRNWEMLLEPAAAREEYGNGWPAVLAAYQEHTAPVWVALLHTPGPGVAGESLTADPLFGEHLAFLRRVRERGWLVAAGPFGDVPGSGMTVLRVPAEDGLAEAERLARTDDKAVASGLLDVAVRRWQVAVTG